MRGRMVVLTCVLGAAGCANEGAIVNAPPGCSDASSVSAGLAATASGGVTPVTAEELLNAMGVDPEGTTPVLTGSPLAIAVFDDLGSVEPTQGSTFAWLSTGVAGAGTSSAVSTSDPTQFGTNLGLVDCAGAGTFDCARLRHAFTVPEGHHGVRFDFEFFSTEYPEFLNAGYNDRFTVSLESPSYNFTNISTDEEGNPINVNNALFTDRDCEDFVGSGFDIEAGFGSCDAGATGLLGTIAPVAPGEVVILTFTLADAGDAIYDSAVMIDRLETTENSVEDPETNDCD